MNQFKIPVVAEAGALQKALGLPAVKRTITYDYRKRPDQITIRTFRVPTTQEYGSYALYFTPKDQQRCVINIDEDCRYVKSNGQTTRVRTGEKRIQIMGSATDDMLDTLIAIAREIDRQIDIKMRGKRKHEIEDPEEELVSTRWA